MFSKTVYDRFAFEHSNALEYSRGDYSAGKQLFLHNRQIPEFWDVETGFKCDSTGPNQVAEFSS